MVLDSSQVSSGPFKELLGRRWHALGCLIRKDLVWGETETKTEGQRQRKRKEEEGGRGGQGEGRGRKRKENGPESFHISALFFAGRF